MIKPREMSKLLIVGPDTQLKKTISTLHSLKVLHIVEHKKDDIDIGKPLAEAEKLAELLVKNKSLISYLKPKNKPEHSSKKLNIKTIEKGLLELESDTNNKIERLKTIEEKKSALNEKIKKLKEISSLDLDLSSFSEYNSLSWFLGHLDKIDSFTKDLDKITRRFKLKNDNALMALFIDSSKEKQTIELLNKHSFKPIDISILEGLSGDIQKNIASLNKSLTKLEKQSSMLQKYLSYLAREYSKQLLEQNKFLQQETEKAEAPLKFAKTESSFIVTGWAPKKKAQDTITKLNKITKNKLYTRIEEPKEKDNVPVELENPKAVKPFEFFMNLYTLPKYREIDPTFFISLTFPLFFGFMLGDFGYGITTLLLFIFLKKKIPKAKNFFNVLIYASIATIFFGLLFGEFFGAEVLFGFHLPHILSRAHQINELLYIAIGIGIVHVNWGLIAGFFNEKKSHGLKHAVYAKLSWLVLEIGAALLALSLFDVIVIHWSAGAVFLLAAVVMLFLGEGVNGLVEIPSIFTNILSYARLMAIGLASVQLAIVVNKFAFDFFSAGGFMIIAAILILVIGHVINILLGLLGGFLHSLRLEYVEFFTKFFKGGAKRYVPFGYGG